MSDLHVEIFKRFGDDGSGGHVELGRSARINGAEVPIVDYLVEADAKTGQPLLQLTLEPSSLSIDGPQSTPVAPAAQVVPQKPAPVSVWGSPGRDPREDIPGWSLEALGEQVARNAARLA
jgi:hypothetical protein